MNSLNIKRGMRTIFSALILVIGLVLILFLKEQYPFLNPFFIAPFFVYVIYFFAINLISIKIYSFAFYILYFTPMCGLFFVYFAREICIVLSAILVLNFLSGVTSGLNGISFWKTTFINLAGFFSPLLVITLFVFAFDSTNSFEFMKDVSILLAKYAFAFVFAIFLGFVVGKISTRISLPKLFADD